MLGTLLAVVVGGVIALLAQVAVAFIQDRLTHERETRSALRDQRREAYATFLGRISEHRVSRSTESAVERLRASHDEEHGPGSFHAMRREYSASAPDLDKALLSAMDPIAVLVAAHALVEIVAPSDTAKAASALLRTVLDASADLPIDEDPTRAFRVLAQRDLGVK